MRTSLDEPILESVGLNSTSLLLLHSGVEWLDVHWTHKSKLPLLPHMPVTNSGEHFVRGGEGSTLVALL